MLYFLACLHLARTLAIELSYSNNMAYYRKPCDYNFFRFSLVDFIVAAGGSQFLVTIFMIESECGMVREYGKPF